MTMIGANIAAEKHHILEILWVLSINTTSINMIKYANINHHLLSEGFT